MPGNVNSSSSQGEPVQVQPNDPMNVDPPVVNVSFTSNQPSVTFLAAGDGMDVDFDGRSSPLGKVDLQDPNNIFQGFDPETVGIVALIGIVMAIQAKSSSDFWKNMWEQASETMQMQLEFAPIIAKATVASAKAAADATREDANKALWSAIVGFAMFAMNMGLTAYSMSNSSPANSANANEAAEKVAAKEAEEEAKNVSTNSNLKEEFLKGLEKAIGISRLTDTLNQIATGFISHAYDQRKAKHQEEQGVQDALAKISEQYVQFFAQYFNRTQDQVPQGQQMIDQVNNILKSISDNVLQGTFKMFS